MKGKHVKQGRSATLLRKEHDPARKGRKSDDQKYFEKYVYESGRDV
jgi:hypothetical protein